MSAWQVIVAGALVPLVIWVLWRLQTGSVELLRVRLVKVARHANWLYHTVSWFGIFLHEMSHAVVLLLSGQGIRDMRVHTESGHVTPRRQHRKGVGLLFFLAAALAPLFIPPALVLVGLMLLVAPDLIAWASLAPGGIAAGFAVLRDTLIWFPRDLLMALATLDLRDPAHLLVFALVLLGAPSSRPSFVKSRYHGASDEGDIAVVRLRIKERPWPVIAVVGGLWLLYVLLGLVAGGAPWAAAFWWPVQALWAVAGTGIVLALLGAAVWSLVYEATRVRAIVAWVPLAAFVATQIVARSFEPGWPMVAINLASVAAWTGSTAVLRAVAPRRSVYDRF